MFHSRIVSIAIAIASAIVWTAGLSACAATPGYAPADDAEGYGHYSTRLDENRYRIVYNGNRATGPNTTRDYALLRAAQLTLADGYEWFEVVDRESVTVQDREPRTDFSVERAYYVERNCGLLGCSRSVRPWTTTRLDTDAGRSRATHSHMLEIVMGKGEMPEDGGNYYHAGTVATSLLKSS